jgi:hypothetical protein
LQRASFCPLQKSEHREKACFADVFECLAMLCPKAKNKKRTAGCKKRTATLIESLLLPSFS